LPPPEDSEFASFEDSKMENSEIREIPCPFCQKLFHKRGNLNIHIRSVHEKKKTERKHRMRLNEGRAPSFIRKKTDLGKTEASEVENEAPKFILNLRDKKDKGASKNSTLPELLVHCDERF